VLTLAEFAIEIPIGMHENPHILPSVKIPGLTFFLMMQTSCRDYYASGLDFYIGTCEDVKKQELRTKV
jgi:hypothetical protein